jgi:hypothetical protein
MLLILPAALIPPVIAGILPFTKVVGILTPCFVLILEPVFWILKLIEKKIRYGLPEEV